MAERFLSLEEVMQYLETDRRGVEDLVRRGKLVAYRVGGTYLRFKKEEVAGLLVPRRRSFSWTLASTDRSLTHRLRDFWAFNNLYIVSALVLLVLVAIFYQ